MSVSLTCERLTNCRFQKKIYIPLPCEEARIHILKVIFIEISAPNSDTCQFHIGDDSDITEDQYRLLSQTTEG